MILPTLVFPALEQTNTFSGVSVTQMKDCLDTWTYLTAVLDNSVLKDFFNY
jgi:hypothetical protein